MIDAEQVREVTEAVLRRPAYREIPGSPWARAIEELRAWFADLIDGVLATSTAGRVGQLVGVAVVVLVVIVLVSSLLSLRRRGAADVVVDHVDDASRAELMATADAHLAAGRLAEAVRARYGALVVLLVERDVLLGRPGTTVGEVDAVVASAVPGAATDVALAGRALAEVVYGHRSAAVADDRAVAQAITSLEQELASAMAGGGM